MFLEKYILGYEISKMGESFILVWNVILKLVIFGKYLLCCVKGNVLGVFYVF